MPSAVAALAVAFGGILLAELGDKSQLLVMAQAARHPPARVLAEAVVAFALLTALAVTLGAFIARYVPAVWLLTAAGLLFLVFGVQAWREAREATKGQEDDPVARRPRGGTFLLVMVSEMGDKTQLATAALAASSGHAVATGLGAWAALVVSAALAVAAGGWLGRRVDPLWRARASMLLFFALGGSTLVLAWAKWT